MEFVFCGIFETLAIERVHPTGAISSDPLLIEGTLRVSEVTAVGWQYPTRFAVESSENAEIEGVVNGRRWVARSSPYTRNDEILHGQNGKVVVQNVAKQTCSLGDVDLTLEGGG